jgi:hypothetical protein
LDNVASTSEHIIKDVIEGKIKGTLDYAIPLRRSDYTQICPGCGSTMSRGAARCMSCETNRRQEIPTKGTREWAHAMALKVLARHKERTSHA